ncbi:hypothetical protein ABW20_dc0102636 [Dactylellina cionopaga]|nr:hypothetical protein ABW20_dc0102636 [Dactylellina cionopaga]
MKISVCLIVFAGVVAAAPQGITDILMKRIPQYGGNQAKRCGGSSSKKCSSGEVCAGAAELKDGMGVCIKDPKPCADYKGDRCIQDGKTLCVVDSAVVCGPGTTICGGSVCLPGEYIDKFGLKKKPSEPKRCGSSYGKSCAKGETCLGEKELKDGMGVCIKDPKRCGSHPGNVCPTDGSYLCVSDPGTICEPGKDFCGGGMCLPGTYIDKIGLNVRDVGDAKRCGGSSSKKCGKNEVCVGEKQFKDGLGVCVKEPKPCGNFFGDTCPLLGNWSCLNDPRIDCPEGVMDCGGGICVPGEWATKFAKPTPKAPAPTSTPPTKPAPLIKTTAKPVT